ncbi:MAG TPA: SxtJ family membrane protein [Armatimonadota bacterium]|nr:SxtJ family membrane protein [Armatimonadota bacterium]
MGLVRVDWRPGPRQLRQFGLAALAGSLAVGGLLYWRGHGAAAMGLVGAGGLAAILGLTGTQMALPVYWAWMGLAFAMGHVMTRLLLGIAYFGIITPMGLAMRALGRDRLRLRRQSGTYWRPVPPGSSDYERQF